MTHSSRSFKSHHVVLPLLFYLDHEANKFQKGAMSSACVWDDIFSTLAEGHQGMGQ